jgi:hypothetical protein
MSAALARVRRVAPLVSRIVAAIVGGYALAALTSVAALALPIAAPQGVITGMLASFVVYTCVVIGVFRAARRAWGRLDRGGAAVAGVVVRLDVGRRRKVMANPNDGSPQVRDNGRAPKSTKSKSTKSTGTQSKGVRQSMSDLHTWAGCWSAGCCTRCS